MSFNIFEEPEFNEVIILTDDPIMGNGLVGASNLLLIPPGPTPGVFNRLFSVDSTSGIMAKVLLSPAPQTRGRDGLPLASHIIYVKTQCVFFFFLDPMGKFSEK